MAKIYVVSDILDADVKVYKAPLAYTCDAAVYVTSDPAEAEKRGSVWYEVADENKDDADVTKVAYVDDSFGADLQIFFVDNLFDAQWNSRNAWGNRMKYLSEKVAEGMNAEAAEEETAKKYRPACIYVVDNQYDADVIAYEVNNFFSSDVCAFVADNDLYDYRGDEIWHYTEDADDPHAVKLYWTDEPMLANLKVYFVRYAIDARWQGNHPLQFNLSK